MDDYPAEQAIQQRYEILLPILDERLLRLWAAAEALALGTRGVTTLAKMTGLSRSTVRAGIKQLKEPDSECMRLTEMGRVRKPGTGRKSAVQRERGIEKELESLMDDSEGETSGSLVWTCKSLRKLAEELRGSGYQVSYRTVGNLLHRLGYNFGRSGDYKKWSLADRREGFCRIARTTNAFLESREPVLLIRCHVSPGGGENSCLVISGLLAWWRQSGLQRFPQARRMLLVTESTVAESSWTVALEAFIEELGVEVTVAQFPPGAWRWRSSVWQVVCSCSFAVETGGMIEIGASIDLILQDKGIA